MVTDFCLFQCRHVPQGMAVIFLSSPICVLLRLQ
jgi:hypothetical protein